MSANVPLPSVSGLGELTYAGNRLISDRHGSTLRENRIDRSNNDATMPMGRGTRISCDGRRMGVAWGDRCTSLSFVDPATMEEHHNAS
jgi:hypothetical protein